LGQAESSPQPGYQKASSDESFRIIDRAVDAGINLLDTANFYNRGASEELVGKALSRNGRRDKVIISTKYYMRMDPQDPNSEGTSRRTIIQQCEASLRRLKTDYIDVYLAHRRRADTAVDETLRALDDLVRAGKVRYTGTSTWPAWAVVDALWASKELHLHRFVCEQPPYNILDRRIERELLPMAQAFGIAVVAWSPLAGGLLTGKYRRGEPIPDSFRYAKKGARFTTRRNEQAMSVVEALRSVADAKGCTLGQLAVAWAGRSSMGVVPLIGPRTVQQLEEYLGALAVEVTRDDEAKIDDLVAPGGMVSPFYDAFPSESAGVSGDSQWWANFSAPTYHW
jgi:aryl-alcohol dehydrogenase-like predicted oxidoreductase